LKIDKTPPATLSGSAPAVRTAIKSRKVALTKKRRLEHALEGRKRVKRPAFGPNAEYGAVFADEEEHSDDEIETELTLQDLREKPPKDVFLNSLKYGCTPCILDDYNRKACLHDCLVVIFTDLLKRKQ